jgi:hypothetical protein
MSTLPTSGLAADVLSGDCPCMECGYNLRGLTPAGNCPECNKSIAESVAANARIVWSKDELRGFRMAVTVLAVVGIASVLEGIFFRPIWRVLIEFLHVPARLVLSGYQILSGLEQLISILATGYLIRRKKFRDRWDRWAILAVWLSIAAIIAQQTQSLFFSLLFPLGYGSVTRFLCDVSTHTIVTCCTVVMYWFVYRILEEMAARMKGRFLAAESRWIRRIYCPLLMLEWGAFIVMRLATRPWISQWTFYAPGGSMSRAFSQSLILAMSIVQYLGMALAGPYLVFFQIRFRFLMSRQIASTEGPQ